MVDVEWRGAPRIDEKNVDTFTTVELRAMLVAARAIDPDFATLVRPWAQAGMRAGELSGLQWRGVDLERGTVLIRRTWSRQRLASVLLRVYARWMPQDIGMASEATSRNPGATGCPHDPWPWRSERDRAT